MLEKTRELANGIEPYLIDNTTQEEDALKKLAEETLKHDWQGSGPSQINSLEPEMLSGHVEGMFLRQIVALANCKKYFRNWVIFRLLCSGYGSSIAR